MLEPRSFLSSSFFSVFLLIVAMISIQSGASLAKGLFPVLGAEGTTTLRLIFAAAILCAVWRPWSRKLTRRELRLVSAYGLSLGGMNLLFYLSLARIPLGLAVAVEFIGPLSVALFASRKPLDFLWALCAAFGILLVLPFGSGDEPINLYGLLLALAAGGCWALYILFGQRAGAGTHAGMVSAVGMCVAALLVAPIGILNSGTGLFNLEYLPAALGVAVLSSAIPYSLEMVALKRLSTKNFGVLMSLEPALAAMSGLFFLGERLTSKQWLAILLIIVASIGSTLSGKRND